MGNRRTAAISAIALVVLVAPVTESIASSRSDLVSRASGSDGAKANQPAFADGVSADGRFATFSTTASNLDPGDGNGLADVFVRDIATSTTVLASRASGPDGTVGNGTSGGGSISGDGRRVAFVSTATNLDPHIDPPPGPAYVYVRDLVSQTTTLASRADGIAGVTPNADSLTPEISADGRFVVFESRATNLLAQPHAVGQIYIRDLEAGRTLLASTKAGEPANFGVLYPSISADGTKVAFASASSNLGPADPLGQLVIYVRDESSGSIVTASRKSGGRGSVQPGNQPQISADGNHVVFEGGGLADGEKGGGNSDVYLRDLAKQKTTWLSRGVPDANDSKPPSICSEDASVSADGRYTVFEVLGCEGENSKKDRAKITPRLYLRDLKSPNAVKVPGGAGRKGTNDELRPSISADGRRAAFTSKRDDLDEDDRDTGADAYVLKLGNR